MATFKRCDDSVKEMADKLLSEFETHKPIVDAKLRIDFLFAFPELDETTGEPVNDALTKNGIRALGICRKIPLKDRAKGMGDAEICLDGHWWEHSDQAEQRALLDHELHHLVPTSKRDDLGRPLLKLRKHDFEFGWFSVIAARHGTASQERIQAKRMMDNAGQYFWPDLAQTQTRMTRVASEVQKR